MGEKKLEEDKTRGKTREVGTEKTKKQGEERKNRRAEKKKKEKV